MNESEYEEGEEEDLGFDEFQRKKWGSGKVPSSSNPRGAGRPSKEWLEYREFLEWKELKNAGITPRTLHDILTGDGGTGKRSGEGTSPRLVRGLLRALFPLKEKEIEKMKLDKADEFIEKGYKHLAPWVMPVLLKPAAILVGIGIYYFVEKYWVKKDKYTAEEWAALPDYKKDDYIKTITKDDGTVIAIKKRLYPILQSTVAMIKFLTDFLMDISDNFGAGNLLPFNSILDTIEHFKEGEWGAGIFQLALGPIGSWLEPFLFTDKD